MRIGILVLMASLLSGCAFRDAAVDDNAVAFMPRDVALHYIMQNLKPWDDGQGIDACEITDTGVVMDGAFHAFADTRLIIEYYSLTDAYDIRVLQNTWVLPDFCSYYAGDAHSGPGDTQSGKIDRIGTAFVSLGANVPSK